MTLQDFQVKYQEIRDMLEDMYSYRKDELDFDLIARVLAKYYDELTDYDIRQIINEIVDYYDIALSKGENYNIISSIVKKYLPSINVADSLSKRDKLIMEKSQLEDLIDQIKEELEYCDDDEQRETLKRELSRLKRELFQVKREIERLENRTKPKPKPKKVKPKPKIVIKREVKVEKVERVKPRPIEPMPKPMPMIKSMPKPKPRIEYVREVREVKVERTEVSIDLAKLIVYFIVTMFLYQLLGIGVGYLISKLLGFI